MARWRVRDPGSFPPDFHRALRQGVGVDKVVAQCYTQARAKSLQREWQIFRFALRNYASYPLARMEATLSHRTRVALNCDTSMWELLLTSRESVLQDMIGEP